MKNKINSTKKSFFRTSFLILSISIFILSGCRSTKTASDAAHANSKETVSKSNTNATKDSNSKVVNLSDTSNPKKIKKCFFRDFLKAFVNPYEDMNIDPEEYPEYEYDNQIEYDDIRDQRD